MRKFVVVLLIIIAVTGILIDVVINRQVKQGIPLSDCYLDSAHCLQTVLWIIFAIISGLTLLFDPQPMVMLLMKVAPWKAKEFSVRLLGFFLLVSLPLSIYSLVHDCNVSCISLLVK
jgi:hypothetical protein